ncbi:hypothetical protein [Streptomyces sp. CBMA29]|uniref:hypothetical protein n=1 Tax=Streptomyces sp. CBMA29 TaxID=1896314 RepID=UPI001CB727EC|nr:hypothetical protein [Streptomyces sp. CBMA29]
MPCTRLYGALTPQLPDVVLWSKNVATDNPLRVATHEYAALARDLSAAPTWRARARWASAPPSRRW